MLEIIGENNERGRVRMKKEYLLALCAFFFMSLSTVAITHAGESAALKEKVIHVYKEDVTGDKKLDKIELKGIQMESNSQYMKKVWAKIISSNKTEFRIDYEQGYEPKIEFVDLNHDGVKDLLESSATGGSGGIYNYSLTTIKDGQEAEIPLPPQLDLQGHFENNFKATLIIPETKETVKLNLSDRKNDYIQSGLYQANGQLNEPTELMIDPVALYKVVKVKNKEGYGLKSFRQISGAYHADGLGTVTSTWYYEDGKWQLINALWQER